MSLDSLNRPRHPTPTSGRYIFVVLTKTDEQRKRYVDLEIMPSELAAIGHITTQWAYLEHLMRGHIAGLVRHFGRDAGPQADNDSFRKRFRYWKNLITELAATNPEYAAKSLAVVERIGEIMGDRHLFTHGRVVWKPITDKPLEFKGTKGRARRVHWQQIREIGHRLAIINYDLLGLSGEVVFVHDALPRIAIPPIHSDC